MSRSDDDADIDFGDLPVLDDLAAPTLADNARHAVARAAFLHQILSDDRVIRLFEQWSERLAVDSAQDALKRAGEVYERLTGLDWRDQDAAHPADLEVSSEEALILERAEREVSALFVTAGNVPFADDAISLAKAAGLTWAWLPAELVQAFWLEVAGRLEGRRFEVRFWTEPPETTASPWEFTFRRREGETIPSVLDRLAQELAVFVSALVGRAQVPAGRSIRADEAASIGRDVEAFYRTRVKDPAESMASVGRALKLGADSRRAAYISIDRASKYLSFGAWELQ